MMNITSFRCGRKERAHSTLQVSVNDGDIKPPGSNDIESWTDASLAPRLRDSTKIDEIPAIKHCE
jgi:hypothetical protein